MSAIKITVHGRPLAQKRPKFFSRKMKSGRVFAGAYNPQETEAGRFANAVAFQLPAGFVPLDGPLALSARFIVPAPASASKKKRAAMFAGDIFPAKKPDLDNLLKFIKDCLSGVVWVDDAQICQLREPVEKVYGEHPRTEIEVFRL